MNITSRQDSRVVIRQIPVLLLGAVAVFSLPPLSLSVFHIVGGTDAPGKWFCLFFGLFMGWLLLEFVATLEKMEIDRSRGTLVRIVTGVFRRKRQLVDLAKMKQIRLEIEKDWRGRTYQCLYMCGGDERYLLNTPWKSMNHRKTGRLLSEATGIPFSPVEPGKGEA